MLLPSTGVLKNTDGGGPPRLACTPFFPHAVLGVFQLPATELITGISPGQQNERTLALQFRLWGLLVFSLEFMNVGWL